MKQLFKKNSLNSYKMETDEFIAYHTLIDYIFMSEFVAGSLLVPSNKTIQNDKVPL